MFEKTWPELAMYFVAGAISLLCAVLFSVQFLAPSQAQSVKNNEPTEVIAVKPSTANMQEVEANVANSPQEDTGEIPSGATDLFTLQPYSYDSENRRDPFKPFTMIGASIEGGAVAGPILPLQRYDLEELKLIGIMWDVKNPKAMFLDPSKEVHTLGKDERVGRNNGYIAVIREGEVVVVETQRLRDELVYTTRVIKIDR